MTLLRFLRTRHPGLLLGRHASRLVRPRPWPREASSSPSAAPGSSNAAAVSFPLHKVRNVGILAHIDAGEVLSLACWILEASSTSSLQILARLNRTVRRQEPAFIA